MALGNRGRQARQPDRRRGEDQTVASLAHTLIHAGAIRAMELDINSYWVTLITYGAPGASNPSKLLEGMERPANRYLEPRRSGFLRYLFSLVSTPPPGRLDRTQRTPCRRHRIGIELIKNVLDRRSSEQLEQHAASARAIVEVGDDRLGTVKRLTDLNGQLVQAPGMPDEAVADHRLRVVAHGPRANPYAITGHPCTAASRQVMPPVECTSTSAAASRSAIAWV